MKKLNLIGQRFGRLVVISQAAHNKHHHIRWNCQCDCGGTSITASMHLRSGHSTSCGCAFQETLGKARITHGMTVEGCSPEYNTWSSIIDRCENPNNQAYKNYGGRGIKICDRWRLDPLTFLEDMGKRPDGMSIDRINNNGHYEPDNCRWATAHQQASNKRNNILVGIGDRTVTLKEFSRELGVNYLRLYQRIVFGGMSPQDAAVELMAA